MSERLDLSEVLKGRSRRAVEPGVLADLSEKQASYASTTLPPLGRIGVTVEESPFDGFYPALLDRSTRFDRIELVLSKSSPTGAAWDFLRPFSRIVFLDDGSADVYPRHGHPEHVIARVLPREGYGAQPSGPEFGAGRLPTFGRFANALREGGFVAFGIALEMYGSHERVRYEVDLLESRLLADPRAGRLRASAVHHQPSRSSWNFDRVLSGANLPAKTARVLETIWEAGAVSEADLERVFGEAEGGSEAIRRLSRLRLIEADPALGGWRVRRDSLGRAPRSAPPTTAPREAESALRHNMGELLAGAEARATCPMCGEEFPPGYSGLLCERCGREVARATQTG